MNPGSVQELLQRFPLFKDLTDSEIKPIVQLAKNRMYRQGTHIFMQDDPLTNVYFIHQGQIKIYRTDMQGKEQIVNVLQQGDMFPHMGFFRKGNYPAHAQVSEDALLIYIPIQLFEEFLVTNPEVCVKIFRILGDKLVDLQNRLEEKILHNTYEQIILLLIRLAKNHGKKVNDTEFSITTHFTNRDLANMIGSSRETVSRTLTYLKKKDLLYTDSIGNIVLHIDKLKEELF
ncbi:Crp/Fnr family transcriptional regulator [Psychrobacillus sp.]|uniref:Crp/Fnr family transcriptional regulator n=1 Tax=Psychrobacillus sp. TaxID=1871623 RepID=UPI0028BDF4DD|nr:Crp/Fnr family transcriptional regulator [Psychrobacillus sp.]